MSSPSHINSKLIGALAYLGGPFTGILMLLLIKKNSYVRFHAMQSSIVFGGILLFYITLDIIPYVGWLTEFLVFLVTITFSSLLMLFLMFKSFSGEKYRLPYFGDIADKQLAKIS